MVNVNERILVSFNHGVAIMLDGRVIFTSCAICEEVFQSQVSVTPKQDSKSRKEKDISPKEAMENAPSLAIDFPMFLRVLALGDGQTLSKPIDLIVKWNNISAICNL